MCKTKDTPYQTRLKLLEAHAEVNHLRNRLDHYIKKQVAINQEMLNYKAKEQTAEEAAEKTIEIIRNFN